MIDFLPFPDIKGEMQEEIVRSANEYLYRLREAVEIELSTISEKNLDPVFLERIKKIEEQIATMKNG